MQLVQSKCPGCKNVLRIPAEWIHQTIRCKYCGLVMKVKQSSPSALPATILPSPTSPSVPRENTPFVSTAPAAPLDVPVGQGSERSPFSDLGGAEGTEVLRSARRRRKRGSWWKGLVIVLVVFAIAGIGTAANWNRIVALVTLANEQPIAQNDHKDEGAVASVPAKNPKDKKSPVEPHPDKDKTKINPTSLNNSIFPRRALIISVHDYLYANPIHNGPPGPQFNNLHTFIESLNRGLKIPLNQIAHLSDDAMGKYKPRAPTKAIIETTLTNFLNSSRARDHIMVFFIGHSVELSNDVYLAPIEGELDKASTLIPLKWFYEQLAKCKARQKVLVLDINRFNQTFGQERPGGEAMGPKLDAMLKEPPLGVQVWSSCAAKQRSYETDESQMGVFLDNLLIALKKGSSNRIQQAEEPLPLEPYLAEVNERMKEELNPRKLEQVSRLTGKENDVGLTVDNSEPLPPDALTCLADVPTAAAQNKAAIEFVLDQIATPPVKVTHEMALRYDALPPFSPELLKKYEEDKSNTESPLRKAVKTARASLWAIYPGAEPKSLNGEVRSLRQKVKVRLDVLRDGYRAPAGGNAENQFKGRVENDERAVARLMRALQDTLDELESEAVVEAKNKESKRWKANYDFMLARIQMEYAYLYEYQSMLGQMRKEFPPRNPALHGGWKLASQAALQGDAKGKKFAKNASKLFDKIAKDQAGTPWEVLAKREKLTNLGLEWQPAR